MNRDRKAFTLLELLVVVTVIVILIAILVPSLDKAMDMAQRTQCLANLDATSIAIAQFASDHKDKYPQYDRWNFLHGSRSQTNYYGDQALMASARPLNTYLGYTSDDAQVKVAQCPSDKGDAIQVDLVTQVPIQHCYTAYGTSYLGAWFYSNNDPNRPWWFRAKSVFGIGPTTGDPNASLRLSQVQPTANKLVLADWIWHANRRWRDHAAQTRWHSDDPDYRQFNVLFADGHSAFISVFHTEVEDPPTWFSTPPDPSFVYW